MLRPLSNLALALALVLTLGWIGQAAAADRPPNVVILLADDLGYADVGFHGCQDVPTPHLDGLAKQSVRCTNGYVSGPYCSPTRAGLLTGRYQQRFGHEFNSGGAGGGLPVEQTTFADLMKAAGYKTGLVGKWHLGSSAAMHPQSRGFDEFFGFLGGARSYFPQNKADPLLRGREQAEEKEYLTDAFAREATAFIDRHRAEPFFLYLAFNAVHTPMEANDARLKKFAGISDKTRQTYAAMLSAMDDAVGAVTAKLKAAGLEENTLIFFCSDNGGPTMKGTTTNASSNQPLRGSKRTTLEGGVRVPMLVSWKGRLQPGVYDQPVIQLDFLPTALAAAGAQPQLKFPLDGVNLLPHLTGQKPEPPHDTLLWRFGEQMAIRKGDWKLVAYDPAVDEDTTSSKAGPGKATSRRLYNLKDDIGEAKDLLSSEPAKAQELLAAWEAWNKELIPPASGAAGKKKGKKAE